MKHLLSPLLILSILCLSTSIDISILRGEKLFNNNTPIILNLNSPDTLKKTSNVDLVCVIDVSGSMDGEKINQVKDSILTLAKMMSVTDRLGIVLFHTNAHTYFDLSEMTPSNLKQLTDKVEAIHAGGGTAILEGLRVGIEILKTKANRASTSGIILLSDGLDNQLNEEGLTAGLRELTYEMKLPFTLHTFGYGNDHDPKTMNRLANLRDGSFYYVEKMNKVKEYFVNVFGGFMSVISSNAIVSIDSNYPIKKVFGLEQLYESSLQDMSFETTILQFIGGKEYTFVLEMDIPSDVRIGEDLFTLTFSYMDLNGKRFVQMEKLKMVEIKNNKLAQEEVKKANEEYIRAETYDRIQKASNLRQQGNADEAKSTLKSMEDWLGSNYKGKGNYIKDVHESSVALDHYEEQGQHFMTSTVSEMQLKRGGSQMAYSNSNQKMLVSMLKI